MNSCIEKETSICWDYVQYKDPASVLNIMKMLGRMRGINNTHCGLYIEYKEKFLLIRKNFYVLKYKDLIKFVSPKDFELKYD